MRYACGTETAYNFTRHICVLCRPWHLDLLNSQISCNLSSNGKFRSFKVIGGYSMTQICLNDWTFFFIFFICVFFHEHSRFIGQLGKVEAISVTSLYHFHPTHRHLDIGRTITAGSSPLHIVISQSRTQVDNH